MVRKRTTAGHLRSGLALSVRYPSRCLTPRRASAPPSAAGPWAHRSAQESEAASEVSSRRVSWWPHHQSRRGPAGQ
ncbi:hypothetical protein ACFPRL_00945 [Pseudoclavibacter helvolus]